METNEGYSWSVCPATEFKARAILGIVIIIVSGLVVTWAADNNYIFGISQSEIVPIEIIDSKENIHRPIQFFRIASTSARISLSSRASKDNRNNAYKQIHYMQPVCSLILQPQK